MWNKQLVLNDVAGQTDAWLCEAAGSICKASGFYTITKTLSETRGIVCRCQKSSLLIIHLVPSLFQDYCAVMGHFSSSLPVSRFFHKTFSTARHTYTMHSSHVLSVGIGIWYKLSVFMEYWH